jgi:hypothetical protein
MPKRAVSILAIMVLVGVAGCSGKKPATTYIDASGKPTIIETDREQCTRACNKESVRCNDTMAAQSMPVSGAPEGMFGASADCRNELGNCLKDCKSR